MRYWKQLSLALGTVILLSIVACLGRPAIDWRQVWTSVVTAAIIAWLTYLFAFFGVPGILRHARKEDQLVEIARLRTLGVQIRNEAEEAAQARKPLSGTALTTWLDDAKGWELEATRAARRFSPVEGERLTTLDRTVPSTIPGLDAEYDRMLRILSTTLIRMDNLCARHSPSQF
jgi:hypothetical protein